MHLVLIVLVCFDILRSTTLHFCMLGIGIFLCFMHLGLRVLACFDILVLPLFCIWAWTNCFGVFCGLTYLTCVCPDLCTFWPACDLTSFSVPFDLCLLWPVYDLAYFGDHFGLCLAGGDICLKYDFFSPNLVDIYGPKSNIFGPKSAKSHQSGNNFGLKWLSGPI